MSSATDGETTFAISSVCVAAWSLLSAADNVTDGAGWSSECESSPSFGISFQIVCLSPQFWVTSK